MTLKLYYWLLILGAVVFLGAWISVIFWVDPERAGLVGRLSFFGTFFGGLASLFILALSRWRNDPSAEPVASDLADSFRQGIWLALFITLVLLLRSLRFLVWWNALLVLAAILLAELFFLSRKK